MSIYRKTVGNDVDVTVHVTGDQNSWTSSQSAAWAVVVDACDRLAREFEPTTKSPHNVIRDVLDLHGEHATEDPNWVSAMILKRLGEANLSIVGTGALKPLKKPEPPKDTW